jgi:hypothetical protein
MENRIGDCTPGARGSEGSAGFSVPYFLIASFLLAIFSAGCASPGEPLERKVLVPAAVTDLAVAQQGDTVVLTFTLPKESVEHRALKDPPAIEVYRAFSLAQPSGTAVLPAAAAPTKPTLYVTIPAAMVDRYSDRGFVRYEDLLKAEDFAQHSGWVAEYTVRTRTSPKKISADSNRADLPIFPAPDPMDDVEAEVTHSGVVLTWTAPQRTIAGPAPPLSSFRIYRAEEETAPAAANPNPSAAAPAENGQSRKTKSPLLKIGESETSTFRDTQAEFGKTYIYVVRSIAPYPGATLESADSNSVVVTPKDIFPPSAPQGLVVILVPAQAGTPASLDLSWEISPETDIAGYNVYRSEQVGIPGQRLNGEPLLTPAFRDMNAVSGHRYFYSVTAVDRSGNESPASAAVSSSVPPESSPSI